MSRQYFGVCLFDSKTSPTEGWACRPNAAPERVTGIHDLSQDINWVTNLDYNTFRQHNLGHLKHICQSQFFRESLDSLMMDYGFREGRFAEASVFLAQHLNNTAVFGNSLLGIDPLRVRNNYRFAQSIAAQLHIPLLKQGARGITQEVADYICSSATQANQAMVGGITNPISYHCYYPRLLYFRWLLNQLVPITPEWSGPKTLSNEKSRIIGYYNGSLKEERFLRVIADEAKKRQRAFFFRISVIKQQKDYAIFGTFGRGKAESREWVTLPELLNLARYSQIELKEYYSLPAGYLKDYIEFLPDLEKIPDISVSMGLFMQNLAAAVMAPVNKKETALGAYLRAYDRVACFHAAEKLYRHEIIPASFSMGRIVVRGTEAQKSNIQACMASLGLIPFVE